MDRAHKVWGPIHWEEKVERAGYGGDPERLWDAMVFPRMHSSFGLTAPQLANDLEKCLLFCDEVRRVLQGPVSDQVIVTALLAMPRPCPYCEEECWEWCDKCAGCPDCCAIDIHCIFCGGPGYIGEYPRCSCLPPGDYLVALFWAEPGRSVGCRGPDCPAWPPT
jgi:hypothetical protein